jgi:motility quorum-sensing regulator/GCU-specific mRNA interferase toxin
MGVKGRGLNGKAKAPLPLGKLQNCVCQPEHPQRSFVSKQGADELGMDDEAVVAIIQGLTSADFEKSMTSMADHRVWQDVYKPSVGGRTIYVKFTLDACQAPLLISFKESGP